MNTGKPGLGLMIWNIAALNGAWLVCVLGAAHGQVWLGLLAVAAVAAAHLALSPARQREAATLLAAAAFGYGIDSLMVLGGAFAFPAQAQIGGPSPIWMVALWVNFATSFNVALHWLARRPVLAAILGAVGGPMAYAGGVELGALVAPAGFWPLVAWVALEWAVATPLALFAAVHIGRWLRQPVPAELGAGARA